MEIINKINNIQKDSNAYLSRVNTTDHDTISMFLELITPRMKFIHVKIYQDKRKQVKGFTLAENLNIRAGGLIYASTRGEIPTRILNYSIAIYVANKYIPNKYLSLIRKDCGEIETRKYLMNKISEQTQ